MATEEQIQAYRADTEARFDEVRAQRVLGRLRAARSRPRGRGRALRGPLLAAAAAALLVFAVDRLVLPQSSPWLLADGSEVRLGEGAQVALARADGAAVRLLQSRGRASYEVTRRSGRTFEVVTPNTTVRVRGTSFDVDATAAATEVRVREGLVEVDDGVRRVLLGAGERLRVTARTQTPAVARVADVAPPHAPAALVGASPATSVEVNVAAHPDPAGAGADTPPRLRTSAEATRPRERDREALLARADEARARGALDAAARDFVEAEALGTSLERAEVAMLLARLEARRGRTEQAARAYQRCLRHAPRGPHAQDALAGAALAWADAGEVARAREAATDYLARWPAGLHETAMQRLLAR